MQCRFCGRPGDQAKVVRVDVDDRRGGLGMIQHIGGIDAEEHCFAFADLERLGEIRVEAQYTRTLDGAQSHVAALAGLGILEKNLSSACIGDRAQSTDTLQRGGHSRALRIFYLFQRCSTTSRKEGSCGGSLLPMDLSFGIERPDDIRRPVTDETAKNIVSVQRRITGNRQRLAGVPIEYPARLPAFRDSGKNTVALAQELLARADRQLELSVGAEICTR